METGGNHRPTVFISYADEDRLSAERLHHDLARHGHACFLAQSRQKEDEWLAATAEGLSQSYAVIVVVGNRTRQDRWVQVELLAALDKRKQIIPFLVGAYPLPVCLPEDIPTILGYADYDASLTQLLKRLPTPPTTATTSWTSLDPHLIHRAAELVYMDQLKLAELKHVAQYTPRLSGNRAVLLLDGLNEIPAHQHAQKYRQLDQFLARFPELIVVVSCREQDYPADRQLTLDRVTISPLDPVRVHEFIHNYLDPLHGAKGMPCSGNWPGPKHRRPINDLLVIRVSR
ncbi:MAG: TIR domain-containing protein [Chloroflexi bacterium]|nr:TIR domain-containing protein [Chloroflexota bacterium]